MKIQIYNTLNRKKEEFIPLDKNNVRVYVCGPTVYDHAHLGNAKTAVIFDAFHRFLKQVYGKEHVTYVSNITDVDDKILNKAKDTGKSIREITDTTYQWYMDDMKKLNVLTPDHQPRATEYIQEMIDLVQKLIDNNHAYQVNGEVLFDVESMKNYGFLSGRSLKDMLAGARIEVSDYKKNPADFILWKPAATDEPGWNSPWGYGRPGWHLECSAMSSKLLGNSFDIHGGGSDLIFPHHENECAQSCCAHPDDTYAKYWMHAGMLMVDGVKMSKSLNNFYIVDDVLKQYPAEALRLLFLSTHYHQPFNFTFDGLQKAKETLDKFYNAVKGIKAEPKSDAIDPRVLEALADDMNTPLAISYLHELASNVNKAETEADKNQAAEVMLSSAGLLGLVYQDPEVWFKGDADDTDIEAQIKARADAKKNKDFALADKIRNDLKDQGIILEDTPQGTAWKRA